MAGDIARAVCIAQQGLHGLVMRLVTCPMSPVEACALMRAL